MSNGTNGNDTLVGTQGDDTIIGNAGDDTISALGGADLVYGDGVDPTDIPSNSGASSGNILDPADIPDRLSGSQDVTVADLLDGSDDKMDMGDENEGGQRDDFRIVDTSGSTELTGEVDFKFPGKASGDQTADIARFDLSTFNDDFTMIVKSEDLKSAEGDNDPFDFDGVNQDLIVLENVETITDNGDGTVSVTYIGRDGDQHQVDIEFNGARIEAYGPDGEEIVSSFDDNIDAGAGNDTVIGGVGDDTIVGDSGDDLLYGDVENPFIDFTDASSALSFNDVIHGGEGNDTIDGGLGDDTISGDEGADTFIASVGNDSISGGTGTDTYDASGTSDDTSPPPPVFGDNILDPADIPDRLPGSQDVTVEDLLDGSDDKMDMGDENEGGQRDDFRIVDTSGSTELTGEVDFKFPGKASGDHTPDIARFDLSTFNDDFTMIVKSEDLKSAEGDNDPFDFDGPNQDLIVLEDVDSITDNGDGTVSVTYTGRDGDQNQIDIEYNGARIEAYGAGGEPITGDVIQNINVTVGTTGANDDNIANFGDGTVVKEDFEGNAGTDTIDDVENFVANEVDGEIDKITLTGPVLTTDVNISNDAIGTFRDSDGNEFAFGGDGEPTINDILNGPAFQQTGTWSIIDGAEDGEVGGITFENFENIHFETVCFVRGTLIETEHGPKPIEEITTGDLVLTADNGLQPVRWITSTKVEGRGISAPILIRAGALGNTRDLWVSPQHRMLLSGWRLELMLDDPEALVPAKHLVNDSTILQVEVDEVEYFHMMFEEHEIVYSEGALSESFQPGRMGVGSFSEDTRTEIFRFFPELETDLEAYGPAARATLKAHEARVLVHAGIAE